MGLEALIVAQMTGRPVTAPSGPGLPKPYPWTTCRSDPSLNLVRPARWREPRGSPRMCWRKADMRRAEDLAKRQGFLLIGQFTNSLPVVFGACELAFSFWDPTAFSHPRKRLC
jgi:hypothetical protein